MTPSDHELLAHLREEYRGVFDEEMLADFVRDYVGEDVAAQQVQRVLRLAAGADRVLDIGSGYGSFVLSALRAGLDARGIEISPYEVDYARRRLADASPHLDADDVYIAGSAYDLPFAAGAFDVVTAWNVLEHVEDLEAVLRESARVLRPGGIMFIVAPNYVSLRREAHYQVPWLPLLPRAVGVRYLRALGRDPAFFAQSIHYRTVVGMRRALRRAGFAPAVVEPQSLSKLSDPGLISRPAVRRAVTVGVRIGAAPVVAAAARSLARSPVTRSIDVVARRLP